MWSEGVRVYMSERNLLDKARGVSLEAFAVVWEKQYKGLIRSEIKGKSNDC